MLRKNKYLIYETITEYFQIIINMIMFLAVIPIGYYFIYALPLYNQQKIDLEREKFKESQERYDYEQRELRKKYEKDQEEKGVRKYDLENCLTIANQDKKEKTDKAASIHNDCLEEGKPVNECKNAFFYFIDEIEKKEQEFKNECFKKYPQD